MTFSPIAAGLVFRIVRDSKMCNARRRTSFTPSRKAAVKLRATVHPNTAPGGAGRRSG
jgi:hypothetical protein